MEAAFPSAFAASQRHFIRYENIFKFIASPKIKKLRNRGIINETTNAKMWKNILLSLAKLTTMTTTMILLVAMTMCLPARRTPFYSDNDNESAKTRKKHAGKKCKN